MSETVELNTLGAVIKEAYEGRPNTNAFTDAAAEKLASLPSAEVIGAKVSSDITDYAGAVAITNVIACTQAQYDSYAALDPLPANFSTTEFMITDA